MLKSVLINIDLSIWTYKKSGYVSKGSGLYGSPASLGTHIRFFIITIKTAVSDFLQSDTAV